MTTILSTQLSPVSTVSASWLAFVTLEPVVPAEQVSSATLYDIYRMFLRAQDGIPASTYKAYGCPIEFDGDLVRIELEFYAWPSAKDLRFQLAASIGDIGTPEIIELPRERDLVFGMTDQYDLDFLPLAASLSWQTPCYARYWSPVASPQLALENSRILLPQEIFGVARLQADAWGHKYKLTITVDKADNRLTGLVPVITAVWKESNGEAGSAQVELQLPPCVEFALSLCDGDLGNTYCSHVKREMKAYYSICTGDVISVVPGPDPESYCSDIAV